MSKIIFEFKMKCKKCGKNDITVKRASHGNNLNNKGSGMRICNDCKKLWYRKAWGVKWKR